MKSKNQKKLTMKDLSIESFVTELDNARIETVKGGDATGSTGLCCATLTILTASGRYGPECRSEYPNCGEDNQA